MTDHTRTEKIDGDSIIFVVIQVERETVMTVGLCGCFVDALPFFTPHSSKPRGCGHSMMVAPILSLE